MRSFRIGCYAAALICSIVAKPARAVVVVPTYVDDANGTWTSNQKTVVQDALNDWASHVTTPQNFGITFDFVHGGIGTFLAQWHASYSNMPNGTDIYPWTAGVIHTVDVNVDYLSPVMTNRLEFTTGTVSDQNWDAYTAILHEVGHAMGFSRNFYYDDVGWVSQADKWTSHISGTTFDPAGLHVAMDGDLQHVADANDLMGSSLSNGVRKFIGTGDLSMLQLAYGYSTNAGAANSVPEPGVIGLVGVAGVALLRRRRGAA